MKFTPSQITLVYKKIAFLNLEIKLIDRDTKVQTQCPKQSNSSSLLIIKITL